MPQFDLPLEQLKKYEGMGNCPSDFNEYWERALSEIPSPQYTIKKADFQVKGVSCYNLYFTGVGGAKIHVKFLKPENIKGTMPAVCIFHGYQGHSRDWFEKLPFALSGFVVAAMDVRGQAGFSEDCTKTIGSTFRGHIVRGIDDENPHNLLFRNIFLDTVSLVEILKTMDFVDKEKIGAAGFSQGGALAFACAALSQSINRVAVGYPFLCDYKRVWDMDLPTPPYEELKLYFRLRDPLHKKENYLFNRLGYIDIQWLAERIKSKVKFYTGLIDNMCPPSAQFAVYNKITSEKQMDIYPDFGHEELPNAWEDVLLFMLGM